MMEAQLGEAAFDATRVARLLRAADGSVRVALIGPAGEFASVPLVDRTREGLVRAVQVVAELRARLARPAAPVPPAPPAAAPAWASREDLVQRADAVRRAAAEELPTESFDGDPVSAAVIAAVPSDHDLATLAPEEAERRLSRAEALLAAARVGEDLWRLDPAAHRAPEGSFSTFVRSRPVPVPFVERFAKPSAEPVRPRPAVPVSLPSVRYYGMELRGALPPSQITNGAKVLGPPRNPPRVADRRMVAHGIVEYDRALPDAAVASFDLVPLHASPLDAARALVDLAVSRGSLHYVQEYEDGGMGGETAAINAAQILSKAAGFRLSGQYSDDELRPFLRAYMIARGLIGAAPFAERFGTGAAEPMRPLPPLDAALATTRTFGLHARPASYGAVPEGQFEELPNRPTTSFNFGLVRYRRRLSADDVARFELVPVWDSPEEAAEALFTAQPRLLRSLQTDMEGVPTDDPHEYRRALVRSLASAARVDRRDPRRRFYLLGQFSAEDVAPAVEARLREASGEKIREAAAYQGHGMPRAPEKAAPTVADEINTPSKDIGITLADGWHGLVGYGLRVGSPDAGYTRVELIGPMAAWEAARRAVAVARSESVGPEKTSASAALARIDARLNNERVHAAQASARGMVASMQSGDLKTSVKRGVLFARTIEDVISALKLAGFTPESIAAAGIAPHVEEKIAVAKNSPAANTPEYRKAIVETADKKVTSARRKMSDTNSTARRLEKVADDAEASARRAYGMILEGAKKRAAETRAAAKVAREQANEADAALEKAQKALERAEERYQEAVAASTPKVEKVAEAKAIVRENLAVAPDRSAVDQIAQALDEAMRSLAGMSWQKAEVGADLKFIEGSYRSDLPKEGAYAVGEDRYDEMVSRELKRARAALEPALRPYQNRIAKTRIEPEEKGWMVVSITLK